eukprot:10095744-Lingulodinium_polyedra.AAC.1
MATAFGHLTGEEGRLAGHSKPALGRTSGGPVLERANVDEGHLQAHLGGGLARDPCLDRRELGGRPRDGRAAGVRPLGAEVSIP